MSSAKGHRWGQITPEEDAARQRAAQVLTGARGAHPAGNSRGGVRSRPSRDQPREAVGRAVHIAQQNRVPRDVQRSRGGGARGGRGRGRGRAGADRHKDSLGGVRSRPSRDQSREAVRRAVHIAQQNRVPRDVQQSRGGGARGGRGRGRAGVDRRKGRPCFLSHSTHPPTGEIWARKAGSPLVRSAAVNPAKCFAAFQNRCPG